MSYQRVIYKYEIKKRGYSTIKLPPFSVILDAQVIDDKLFIWIEHVLKNLKDSEIFKDRVFFLWNTGEPWAIKYNIYRHIRTVRFASGIIQHLFEVELKIEG